MKKTYVLTVLVALMFTAQADAMVGGPLFCVGKQVTSMTVEVERSSLNVPMEGLSSDRSGSNSKRLFLIGRYGLQDFLDGQLKIGAADLGFDDFGNGFSSFVSNPSLAWGAGLRAGLSITEKLELNANLSYMGFTAEGEVTRAERSISNAYLWQEVIPAITMGYSISDVTPYVGVGKVYLMGRRDFDVTYSGDLLEMASGSEEFSDGKQPMSPLVGLEWHLPDGYSLTGEASSSDGDWNITLGLSQTLR
ncbi:MAG: hypothetical protein IPG71_12315 [bacterium]|nr:hypothetical protein [bacterium]